MRVPETHRCSGRLGGRIVTPVKMYRRGARGLQVQSRLASRSPVGAHSPDSRARPRLAGQSTATTDSDSKVMITREQALACLEILGLVGTPPGPDEMPRAEALGHLLFLVEACALADTDRLDQEALGAGYATAANMVVTGSMGIEGDAGTLVTLQILSRTVEDRIRRTRLDLASLDTPMDAEGGWSPFHAISAVLDAVLTLLAHPAVRVQRERAVRTAGDAHRNRECGPAHPRGTLPSRRRHPRGRAHDTAIAGLCHQFANRVENPPPQRVPLARQRPGCGIRRIVGNVRALASELLALLRTDARRRPPIMSSRGSLRCTPTCCS